MRARRVVVAAFVAACNHGGNAMPDAALGGDATDAAIDAPPPVPGRVDITARTWLGDGLPDPTAIAIFIDPTGNVVQHGLVDAAGNAHAEVIAGSSVTVLQATNDPLTAYRRYVKLTTIRDVHPGDHLVAGRSRDPNLRTGATDTMTATYTDTSPSSSAGLAAACVDGSPDGTPGEFSLVFHASCATPTFDMLVVDDDPTNGMQYVWQTGIDHVAGGSFVVPNTWQPIGHNATTVTNVSANFSLAVQLDEVIGGERFQFDRVTEATPAAGTHDLSLRYVPVGVPTFTMVLMGQGIHLAERRVQVTHASPATLAIDIAEQPLPRASGSIHQSANAVTWTETGSGAPDARVVYWNAKWNDSNGVERDALWTVLENPNTPPSSTLPTLPADYMLDDPTFVDPTRTTTLQGASITYVDWDTVADYAAARAIGDEIIDLEDRDLTVDHHAHETMGAYPF